MTDVVSLVNLALQSFGSRTTLTAAQLAIGSNNEAKQANLAFGNTRDSLLRMAPWNCGMKTANLSYITSVPGTPENSSPALNQWAPGIPRPPWAYEYQYPNDCLRPCWIVPAASTGATGIPITTAVTGGSPTTYAVGPIVYKVAIDSFYPVISVAIATGGAGYAVGDELTMQMGVAGSPPIGAPVVLRVNTVSSSVIVGVDVVNQVAGATPPAGGSYFAPQTAAVTQSSTTGGGSGAQFYLTFGVKGDQRVILTNQQNATMVYVRQVMDPNVWDSLFQDAFYNLLGSNLCIALTGDKGLANACIQLANQAIKEAREADGNEGLTINDVTPDWIRLRGITWSDSTMTGPYAAFNWGGLVPSY